MAFHMNGYSNFHELNIDWFLKKFAEFYSEYAQLKIDWANLQDDWETQQQAFQALQQFVTNYFDNLDVQQEINNKLDEMAKDGTLWDLMESHVNDVLDKVTVEYNILDYEGNSLNKLWDDMRQNFIAWQYKHILIPEPREGHPATIKINNDVKWKIDGPIVFNDKDNCCDIELYGELYAAEDVDQVILFDDIDKPENINFLTGVQIRGDRNYGGHIGNAIEIRSGARINFFGQTIINDCDNGIVIGGPNQKAPADIYLERAQIAFFDTNAISLYGNTYPAYLYADHVETALAQNQNLNAVHIKGKIPNTNIGYLTYGTDVPRTGYVTYNALSVVKMESPNTGDEVHNISIDHVYSTESTYTANIDGSGSGSVYDVHFGQLGGSVNTTIALYARNVSGLTVDNIKRDNLIDIANCFYSRIGRQILDANDNVDRFTGIKTVINIDGVTSINDTPATTYKEIGAITLVKNANGVKGYMFDGTNNIPFDGQMFVPSINALPSPAWNLRGKFYRVNNEAGTDTIAICIRYNGNEYRWFDLISGAVI